MPVLDIGEAINTWTSTRLVRFIKDLFEKDPPTLIGSTSIDNLEVVNTLLVDDQITFRRDPNFHFVGNPGEPSFQNSWVNWGTPYEPAGFWKDPLGFVHLIGLVKTGTVGQTIFTLPAGSRPTFDKIFNQLSNGAVGRVDVTAGGEVKLVAGSNVFVSLEGITFKAR